MSGFYAFYHNGKILDSAESIINQTIAAGGKVWIKDENGNIFVPQGRVSIAFAQPCIVKHQESNKEE